MDNLIKDLETYENALKSEETYVKTPIQTNLLCSGVKFRTPKEDADLRCFYADSGNPWLKLGPIKTEILNYDPYVAAFRELLFDEECDNITEYLSPKLDFPPGRMKSNSLKNDWTMKNTWPVEDDNKVLEKLTLRVEAVMDLLANSKNNESDKFMCGNYGIGGHYGTHPDFSAYSHEEFKVPGSKVNRISTVMTILQSPSAVVHRRSHCFSPYTGAYSYPEKGTGIGWYNLKDDGYPDELTRHAACPVLFGQKWIGNKWIGYTPQIYKKPCSLKMGTKLSGPLPKFKRKKVQNSVSI
ncbi:P4HA [Lepeophtheirus salmonis]|uniref:P4HA n=1 Tax=Lepeophtheirus salmonis TaxID=72036 RepID=A0A7R8CMT3_LEPSM|nr:P4HA [Lepeophtheirus salmonis]CAF2835975.1 P4HA [Lepeophtheirus salmonis]